MRSLPSLGAALLLTVLGACGRDPVVRLAEHARHQRDQTTTRWLPASSEVTGRLISDGWRIDTAEGGASVLELRQERARVASELRAEGAENAEQIRADADRQRTIILAEAYRDAEKVRGEGDAQAADIYASAFEQNPEFFSFYRSMQAYRRSVGREQDLLVLDADSDFLRYLNESRPQR